MQIRRLMTTSNQPIFTLIHKWSYLNQFPAETIETWYTHSPPGCFQYFGEFQRKKIKPGQEVHFKHIYMLARSGK